MIELMVGIALLVGGLWLAAAVVGLAFKLAFALIGGLFGLVSGLFGLVLGGVALLIAAPLVLLVLLPLWLPVLLLAALVWAIARAARGPAHAAAAH
ncbi:hypothetical protein [Frateuria defendens]|uniref:hypothetical protein n=1 Tax=Frateuria defendens TaxID=2219559 RepID=UPI00066FD430|nr:hypothetical protein [Frateuria defendens]